MVLRLSATNFSAPALLVNCHFDRCHHHNDLYGEEEEDDGDAYDEEEVDDDGKVMILLSAVQGPGASDNMLNCAIMLEVNKA